MTGYLEIETTYPSTDYLAVWQDSTERLGVFSWESDAARFWIETPFHVDFCDLSGDGKYISILEWEDGTIITWEVETRKQIGRFSHHGIGAIRLSDGLIRTCTANMMRVCKFDGTLIDEHTWPGEFLYDDSSSVLVKDGADYCVYTADCCKRIMSVRQSGWGVTSAFAPRGPSAERLMVICENNGPVTLLELRTAACLWSRMAPKGLNPVRCGIDTKSGFVLAMYGDLATRATSLIVAHDRRTGEIVDQCIFNAWPCVARYSEGLAGFLTGLGRFVSLDYHKHRLVERAMPARPC